MNKVILFFNYEACFKHYTAAILRMRQAKVHGEAIVAKPVLLLALLEAMDEDVITNNRFHIDEWLEEKYNTLMEKFTKNSQFEKITGIEKPFWHLETDEFWHLKISTLFHEKGVTPSKHWLKENVEYAYLDESLWIMLMHKEWRMNMRNFICENKLKNN